MRSVLKNIVLLCVLIRVMPVGAKTFFTSGDAAVITKTIKNGVPEGTHFLGIMAKGAQIKLRFRAKGIKTDITVDWADREQACKGLKYTGFCITTTRKDDRVVKLVEQVLHRLAVHAAGRGIIQIRRHWAQGRTKDALAILKGFYPDSISPVEGSEVALLWLKFHNKNQWKIFCEAAMKSAKGLSKKPAEYLRMLARCGDGDMIVREYNQLPSSLKQTDQQGNCLAGDLAGLIFERGQTKPAIEVIQSGIDMIPACKELLFTGITMAHAEKDCKLLNQLLEKAGTIRLGPQWVILARHTYIDCGRPDKALLLLLNHDEVCSEAVIQNAIVLASRIKRTNLMVNKLKTLKTSPGCPVRSLVLAIIYMRKGDASLALDILDTHAKNSKSSWYVLIRAMALYKTGRASRAHDLLNPITSGKGEAGNIARGLSDSVSGNMAWEGLGVRIGMFDIYSRQIMTYGIAFGLLLLGLWLWWTRPDHSNSKK